MPFYDTQDYTKSVDGMKIIPLQTSELIRIVMITESIISYMVYLNMLFNQICVLMNGIKRTLKICYNLERGV